MRSPTTTKALRLDSDTLEDDPQRHVSARRHTAERYNALQNRDAMTPSSDRRALPELLMPGGFSELIPQNASAFVTTERLVLQHGSALGVDEVLAARRQHLRHLATPLLVDFPAGDRSSVVITATAVTVASMMNGAELVHRVTVDVIEVPDGSRVAIDHWSLDLDHDGLIHQAMVTGDGSPPPWIIGEAAAHDADRWIALRIVDVTGTVVTASTTIARGGW